MDSEAACWRARGDGVRVRVKLTPAARRAGFGGVVAGRDGPALALAVRAPPREGAANEAARSALAAALGVAPSAVRLGGGAARREKLFDVAGAPAALAARLQALMGGGR